MLYLYGASGHGLVIKDILTLCNIDVDKFIDDNINIKFKDGIEVIHPDLFKINYLDKIIISIGDNKLRKFNASKFISVEFINAIHPSSYISSSVKLGIGVTICANSVINTNVKIGNHVIINSSSCIEHESSIDNFCHISPGSILCGNVKIGEGTHIGAGSTIIPNISIGKWCVIGAGTVVINDIPDYCLVVGVPGKIIKRLNNE